MIVREYSKEEKVAYVEEFKSSGMSQKAFAKEKEIPETTFRGWIKSDREKKFGEIDLGTTTVPTVIRDVSKQPIRKTMVFAKDDIRIELKEGFDKEFLRRIVEVLIYAN